MTDNLAWVPTSYPAGTETIDALVEGFETVAERRLRRPLFVPVHVPAHTLTVADIKTVVDQLDSDIFEVVNPDMFYTLFAKARQDSILLLPPEGFAPSTQLIRSDQANEIIYEIQNFDKEPATVDVTLRLTLNSYGDQIIDEKTVHLDGKQTKEVTSTLIVPDTNSGDGRLEYIIDNDSPMISTPIQFLSDIQSEWVYEAENTNHQNGRQVSDTAALNGIAWQAVAGEDGGSLEQNHVVWEPTMEQSVATDYVARFRMKVADNSLEETIARLDVIENIPGSPPEGEYPHLDVAGTDFAAANEYEWFEVPFTLPLTDAPLSDSQRQYRVAYGGSATLTIDQIEVIGQFESG